MVEPPAIWDDDMGSGSSDSTPPVSKWSTGPVRPRRVVPAMVGLALGLLVCALNAAALAHELGLRIDGTRATMTVQRCDRTGRVRTCTGSYEVAGVAYHERLLLGGDGAQVGQRVVVLVDRRHPGDAATTGLGAAVEAGLLTVAGAVIAAVAARRVVGARRHRKGRRPARQHDGARRSLAGRARVWEGAGDPGAGDPAVDVGDPDDPDGPDDPDDPGRGPSSH